MKVQTIMVTHPVVLGERDRLDLADDIMTLGRIRHIPVVRGEVVVGVLSQRDLFRAAASTALKLNRGAQHTWLERVPVGDVMSTPVITTSPDTDVREVVAKMLKQKIGCVPIVSPDGRLVGLVSESDCLRVLHRILETASTRQELAELQIA